jgi:hypothetical protein
LGAALAAGCTVKEGDDDDTGGAAGDSGSGGTGGTTGGSSGKGGSAGKGGSSGTGGAAGKGGSAGSSAGSSAAGTGGTTGGSAGTGGTGGTSDAGMAGAGDTGNEPVATCDPADGMLDSTPFPNCDADPEDDDCQICIQESCCEESMNCYATEPYNVCGWGGPTEGDYAKMNEIGCFTKCLEDATAANEMTCTADDADSCAVECATPMCFEDAGAFPLIGTATNELAACMQDKCADPCFHAATCGD